MEAERMRDVGRRTRIRELIAATMVLLGIAPGCTMVPRARLDESQRLAQGLRTENAHLQDRVLSLQAQNRDAADRALDDLRRLTARDEAIERLERSVQAYQDDRDRLAAAYQRLASSMGRPTEDSTLGTTMGSDRDPRTGDQ
jgi:hypothetical protein